jgi:hypothetical protein
MSVGGQVGDYYIVIEKDVPVFKQDGENGKFWSNSKVRTYMKSRLDMRIWGIMDNCKCLDWTTKWWPLTFERKGEDYF